MPLPRYVLPYVAVYILILTVDVGQDFILRLGPLLLCRMPKLHTFRVYCPSLSASLLVPDSISPPHTPDLTTPELDTLLLGFPDDSPPPTDMLFASEHRDFSGTEAKDRASRETLKAIARHKNREDEAENELRSMVGSWDRYCPELREVQLAGGFYWKKTQYELPKASGRGWRMVVEGKEQAAPEDEENLAVKDPGKKATGRKWEWVKKSCESMDGGQEYI